MENFNPNWEICSAWYVDENNKTYNKLFTGTYQECNKFMSSYINFILKFKSYYTRVWFDDKNRLWNDYGSYSNFFVFVEGNCGTWEE